MPLTGSRVGASCYTNIADATDAYYSSVAPFVYSNAGSVFETSYAKYNGLWSIMTYALTPSGKVLQTALAAPSGVARFPPCDPTQYLTYTDVFTIPGSPDVATAWMIGFSLPLILYLTAWGFGVVIGMFSNRRD